MFHNTSRVTNINLNKLFVPPKYKRIRSEEDKFLYQSVKNEGLKDPLLVIFDHKKEKYIIIDGVRRFSVVKRLDFKSVPCMVDQGFHGKELSFAEYRDFIRLSIDTKRQDLLPSQRAYYINLLVSKYKISHGDISQACGINERQLQSWLKVADCSAEFRLWIDNKRLPVVSVNYIHRLTKEGESEFLNHFRDHTKITIEQLKEFIQTLSSDRRFVKLSRRTTSVNRHISARYAGAPAATITADLKMYETRLKEVDVEAALMRDELRYAKPFVQQVLSIRELRDSLPGKIMMTFEVFAKNHGLVIERTQT